MNKMIMGLYGKVMAMTKLTDEARADMLAELVVESAKMENDADRMGWDDERKEKYLWSCMWGVSDNWRRLTKCVDRPRRDGDKEQAVVVMLDLDVSWDECDKGRRDVEEKIGLEDVWTDLGRVCRDAIDAKIVGGRSEGFVNREIGEQLGLSEVTIGKRLNDMKARLKEIDRYHYAHI